MPVKPVKPEPAKKAEPPMTSAAPEAETVVVDPELAAARSDVVDAVDWESRVRFQSDRADKAEGQNMLLSSALQAVEEQRDRLRGELEKQLASGAGPGDLRCAACGNKKLEKVNDKAAPTYQPES